MKPAEILELQQKQFRNLQQTTVYPELNHPATKNFDPQQGRPNGPFFFNTNIFYKNIEAACGREYFKNKTKAEILNGI